MAGRKRNLSLEVLYELFDVNERTIVRGNKVVEPSHAIWKEIHESVGKKTTLKAIYTDALRWFEKNRAQENEERNECET